MIHVGHLVPNVNFLINVGDYTHQHTQFDPMQRKREL